MPSKKKRASRASTSTRSKKSRRRRFSQSRFKVTLFFLTLASLAAFYLGATLVYHTVRFSEIIDLRLAGEQFERPSWVYARPFEVRRGQRLAKHELVDVLNSLGYRKEPSARAQREPSESRSEKPWGWGPAALKDDPSGQARASFRFDNDRVLVTRRGRDGIVSIGFEKLWVGSLEHDDAPIQRAIFEPVPVTTLFGSDRAKRRWVALDEIPQDMVNAVIATEDRRFFQHTGLDPIGIVRALVKDISEGSMREGASTITQQLVKNYFLTPEKTIRRKLLEIYLAILLERRADKSQILELYLNEVYLGQRGSFGIHGVGQAAQTFFGKDVQNLELEEAALIAATIRSPNLNSPFDHPERAKIRRDLVLDQMSRFGLTDETQAREAVERPLGVRRGTIDVGEAPSYVDALRRSLIASLPGLVHPGKDFHVYASMDRALQGAAQTAVTEGLDEVGRNLGAKKARDGLPQAALVAMNPKTGDVLALVGSRSYGSSQFNRATDARRQPGSAFKPFVYLAAFEQTHRGLTDEQLTPASWVVDEKTSFRVGSRTWSPQNYTRRFEGRVSYRQALAKSLNVATARVGERIGFERVVELWSNLVPGNKLEPYPSLVLGSFEVTPLELATAYSALANGGLRVEPRWYTAVEDTNGHRLAETPVLQRRVAQPQSAYLVTDMMRSVLSTGTGREIRARGLEADAAGKTGTTNNTRDAWFVGYTPDVLAVVWVGYDDNRPLGLTGSQAALPIWVRFMKAAVSGSERRTFSAPEEIVSRRIDPLTGALATSACPNPQREVFLAGTEPRATCTRH